MWLKAERDILKTAAIYFAKEPKKRRGSGRRIGCAGRAQLQQLNCLRGRQESFFAPDKAISRTVV
jgi:hypothetical protein